MLTVETIDKIRLKHRRCKSIRWLSKEPRLTRNTARKVLHIDETLFVYQRSRKPYPKLGKFIKLRLFRTVQDLFGHKDVEKTMIHTQVLKRGGKVVKSLIDDL